MKRLLSVLALTLVLVLALASCDIIYGVIGMHTVTFDLNGGAVSADFEETVNVFDGKCVKELPVPTKDEYVFDGWYYGEELFTTETAVTGDMTLVAKWHSCKVKLSFVDHLGNLIKDETVDYGSSVIPPAVDAIIGNQKFVKWDKDLSSVTEDMVVKAIYEDNVFTITYDCGDITESFTEKSFVGQLPTVPAIPIVDGHVFCGWYLDAELTERYFFDFNIDNDITLYAKFYDTSLGEYIVISNVDQLKAISEEPDAKYLLACDINCKGDTLTPIEAFGGELDGNGYKIYNFSLNEDADSVGFVRTNNGVIKNLSFGDFTFSVYRISANAKYYGVICGVNNGTVENCHAFGGEVKVDHYNQSNPTTYVYIGGIVGYNSGIIIRCSNSSDINTTSNATGYKANIYYDRESAIYSYVSGICGFITDKAIVSDCMNDGTVVAVVISNKFGLNYTHVSGIVATVEGGKVEKCASLGNISVTTTDNYYVRLFVGGAIAQNNGGNVDSSYTMCDVSIDNATCTEVNSIIGGFAAYNSGKLYNCYSVVNIKDNTPIAQGIGGFVGFNELLTGKESTINKCFAMGSIELSGVPTDIGYLVGRSTGTIKDSYYVDIFTINKITVSEDENGEIVETVEPVEVTNTLGGAKAESELLTVDFLANTLYFDREIWFVYDGKLPTLR